MKVGFGSTILERGLIGAGVDGIGTYTRELGGQLIASGNADLLPVSFGVFDPHVLPFEGRELRVLPRYPRMVVTSAVTGLGFPGQHALKAEVDLFHATDHLIPKFREIPVVATLMDAIPLAHPEWVRIHFASLKNALWRKAARWADHVITISEFSKLDIVKHFGIDAAKISVTPLAVDARYFERIDPTLKAEIAQRLGVANSFFLFVGTLQPRKNVERILAAHETLPDSMRRDHPLVVVGRAGWGCEGLQVRLQQQADEGYVRWLNYLPDLEVRVLMQSALALVFPSLYEGFGLPVLEAFASGLPVISSNSTSLPEVAQDAAVLVDPLDVGAIGDAMRQVATVPALRQQLAEAGLVRAKEFTWAACAEKTLSVYQKVLAG